MAIVIAKTSIIPVIATVRATCAGTQYTVEMPKYIDVVTVNGSHVSCTCHEAGCDHIKAVIHRCVQDAACDARRAAYEASFDLSYGDIVA